MDGAPKDGRSRRDPHGARAFGLGRVAHIIIERIQDPTVKEPLPRNTEQSVARGTFGAPTFFVGEEIFSGKDRLREVEEAILASR